MPSATSADALEIVSGLPPLFLVACIAAILGIPAYLITSGALASADTSRFFKGSDGEAGIGAGAGTAGAKEDGKDGGDPDDPDDPSPPLDLRDLRGLGGLVGLAALVAMAFAMFPEEIADIGHIVSSGRSALRATPAPPLPVQLPPNDPSQVQQVIHVTETLVAATATLRRLSARELSQQHLEILRHHPLLLIGYDPSPPDYHTKWLLALACVPLVGAFVKLNLDASKSELRGREEMQKEKLEKDAAAEALKLKRRKEIEEVKQRKADARVKAIEEEVLTAHGVKRAQDKPWWAPATWNPTSEEEIKAIKETKMPQIERIDPAGPVKRKFANFGINHHRAWFDAQVAAKRAETYKLQSERLAAKWDKDKNPYPGMDPALKKESSSQRSGDLKVKEFERMSKAEQLVAYRTARNWESLKKKGKQSKSNPSSNIEALSSQWDKEEKEERRQEEERMMPILGLGGRAPGARSAGGFGSFTAMPKT